MRPPEHSLALSLTGGLVEGVAQDGVLLLQTGQLGVGALLQLVLQTEDLTEELHVHF